MDDDDIVELMACPVCGLHLPVLELPAHADAHFGCNSQPAPKRQRQPSPPQEHDVQDYVLCDVCGRRVAITELESHALAHRWGLITYQVAGNSHHQRQAHTFVKPAPTLHPKPQNTQPGGGRGRRRIGARRGASPAWGAGGGGVCPPAGAVRLQGAGQCGGRGHAPPPCKTWRGRWGGEVVPAGPTTGTPALSQPQRHCWLSGY